MLLHISTQAASTTAVSYPGVFYIAQANSTYTDSAYGSNEYGTENYGTQASTQTSIGDLANTGTVVLFGVVLVSLIVFTTLFLRVWRRSSNKGKYKA